MLRQDINSSVTHLLFVITKVGLYEILRSRLGPNATGNTDAILACYADYSNYAQRFSQTEKKILATFDLEHLESPPFWGSLLEKDAKRSIVHTTANSVRFLLTYLPELIVLYDREPDTQRTSGTSKAQGKASLTAILIEDNGGSSPQRLVLLLEAISELYSAAATLQGENINELSVTNIDSGSDKSFDFLGAAKVVKTVIDVILSFWDRVVYYREDKSGRHLELIAASLPIIGKISELAEDGALDIEKAELLKRQVMGAVTKFAEAGATIPEIERATTFNPRQLLQPDRRLLPEVAQSTTEETPASSVSDQTELGFVAKKDSDFTALFEKFQTEYEAIKAKESEGETVADQATTGEDSSDPT